MAAVGTHGDVLPLVGLGKRLNEAGHRVSFATKAAFADEVEAHGLTYRAMPGDRDRPMPTSGLRGIREDMEMGRRMAAEAAAGIVAAAEDADVLLVHRDVMVHGYLAAEAEGIPCVTLELYPGAPTGEFAMVTLGVRSLGRSVNRNLLRLMAWMPNPLDSQVRAFQRQLGLAPSGLGPVRMQMLADTRHTILHGFSPAVVPRPRDWRAGIETVGYWWPPSAAGWRPPPELVDFLDAGPPPVYFGLGSMTADRERTADIAAAAIRRAGCRGVVQAGWSGLTVVGKDVLTIGPVPHEWLFPRMAALVHHCGAGTTGAGLRAGVPAVGVPMLSDQPFWADRLVRLGVSPGVVPHRKLTAERLSDALRRAIADPVYRQRAAAVAAKIRREDGAARVLEVLAGIRPRVSSRMRRPG